MSPIYTLIIATIIGVICARIAKKNNRHPVIWFAVGAFLGLIGLFLLYILIYIERRKSLQVATGPVAASIPDEGEPFPIKPSQPPASPMYWYYLDTENKQYGPMSLEGLKRAWTEDQITSQTYIWNEEMENWKPLEELAAIFSEIRGNPSQEQE